MCCYFCNILMLCSLVMFIVLYYFNIINIIFINVCFIIIVLDVIFFELYKIFVDLFVVLLLDLVNVNL